jgi:glycosyltransferase involved in cell wall biosynthesis
LINNKKIVVVLPAYNAEKTLARTVLEIPNGFVDEIVLVDDGSQDSTVEIAISLNLITIRHNENIGYGANQKTCFTEALRLQADVVIMLHPDYQYSPLLIPAMASMVAFGQFDMVLGSRILGRGALAGGMPRYKYVANRILTLIERTYCSTGSFPNTTQATAHLVEKRYKTSHMLPTQTTLFSTIKSSLRPSI